MTVLPNSRGVLFIGCLLRDPGEGPWGGGTRAPHHGPPFPSRSQSCSPPGPEGDALGGCVKVVGPGAGPRTSDCELCAGTGWMNDPYFGATLGARCPCGGN